MGEKAGFGGLGFLVVVCFSVCFLVFLFCFNENRVFFCVRHFYRTLFTQAVHCLPIACEVNMNL